MNLNQLTSFDVSAYLIRSHIAFKVACIGVVRFSLDLIQRYDHSSFEVVFQYRTVSLNQYTSFDVSIMMMNAPGMINKITCCIQGCISAVRFSLDLIQRHAQSSILGCRSMQNCEP